MKPNPLKIAMISPTLGTAFGLEQVLMVSVKGLRERGHQVLLIGETANDSLPETESPTLIPKLFSTPTLLAPKTLREVVKQFEEALRKANPDVVHFLDQPHAEIIKVATSRYPCVLTAHTVSPTCPASHRLAGESVCHKRSGWSCLIENRSQGCLSGFKTDLHRSHAILDFKRKKEATRKMKSIIAISRYVESTLLENGFPRKQVKLIYNPLPEIPSSPERAHSTPLIVSACRLVPLKGIEYAIRALNGVEHLQWDYWILGEGPLRDNLVQLVRELNLQSRIHFKGKQDRETTLKTIQSAKIFLQPNIGPEGFGLSVAEAQALGTPAIAFDTPALNEIIEHEKTGFLVTSKDTLALGQAIKTLLTNDQKYRELSTLAQKETPLRFSRENFIESTLALYQEVRNS